MLGCWSSGLAHDQTGLYAVLFSLRMWAALEVLKGFEKYRGQLVSRKPERRKWRMNDVAQLDVVEPDDR